MNANTMQRAAEAAQTIEEFGRLTELETIKAQRNHAFDKNAELGGILARQQKVNESYVAEVQRLNTLAAQQAARIAELESAADPKNQVRPKAGKTRTVVERIDLAALQQKTQANGAEEPSS